MNRTLNLEQRITRLEDIEAIKQLKLRYFYACDARDVAGVRACFTAKDLLIDAGFIGQYTKVEDFTDMFASMTTSPTHLDQHYGIAPEVKITDDTHASGRWRILFQLLDSDKGVVQFMGGYYADKYLKENGEWKIQQTVYTVSTNLMMKKDSAGLLEAMEMGGMHAIATELENS
ncbi:MAG: nuclear transport factor 2 family protein [Pseudomonadales bacterium]